MCVRDGAGDQTQGSKEDINWKESLMLQSNSVKKKNWRREPWTSLVGDWICGTESVAGVWETLLGASSRECRGEKTSGTISTPLGN